MQIKTLHFTEIDWSRKRREVKQKILEIKIGFEEEVSFNWPFLYLIHLPDIFDADFSSSLSFVRTG